MVRFAVTCPTPIHPKQTKIGMQGKRHTSIYHTKIPHFTEKSKRNPDKMSF